MKTLKRTYLVCLAAVILAGRLMAAGPEAAPPDTTTAPFHPPDWILGRWSDIIAAMSYEFRENDVCLISGPQILSLREIIPHDQV